MRIEEIEAEALKLDVQARARLAKKLLCFQPAGYADG